MGAGLTEAQKQAMLSAAILKLDESYVIVDNVTRDQRGFTEDARRLAQFWDGGDDLDHLTTRQTHTALKSLNAELLALAKKFKEVSYQFKPEE